MNSVALDHPSYRFDWLCEKWSEDAVDFCRKKLDGMGLTHTPGHLTEIEVLVRKPNANVVERLLRKQVSQKINIPALIPIEYGIPSAVLRALVGAPEECAEIQGNLLLNEGIQRLEDLSMIATVVSNQVAGNPWSNGNAFLGVGTSVTAEAASQTDLQTAGFYKAMNATFPSRSGQQVTFQSDFTTAEANQAWAEWSVAAGATGVSGSGFTTGTINLNRKVASLGTKATGTWTLSGQLTLS